jgi:hypothetical protein
VLESWRPRHSHSHSLHSSGLWPTYGELQNSEDVHDAWRCDHIGLHCSHGKTNVCHVSLQIQNFSHFVRWGTRYDFGDSVVRTHLVNFPLQKLLCGLPGHAKIDKPAHIYAILSQRLPLDVSSTVYTPLPLRGETRTRANC